MIAGFLEWFATHPSFKSLEYMQSSDGEALEVMILSLRDIMEKHLKCERLQHFGCAIVANLGMNHYLSPIIVEEGAIHIVLQAMQHASHEGIQHQGCRALQTLAADGSDGADGIDE